VKTGPEVTRAKIVTPPFEALAEGAVDVVVEAVVVKCTTDIHKDPFLL
jgi:hypothetical protein